MSLKVESLLTESQKNHPNYQRAPNTPEFANPDLSQPYRNKQTNTHTHTHTHTPVPSRWGCRPVDLLKSGLQLRVGLDVPVIVGRQHVEHAHTQTKPFKAIEHSFLLNHRYHSAKLFDYATRSSFQKSRTAAAAAATAGMAVAVVGSWANLRGVQASKSKMYRRSQQYFFQKDLNAYLGDAPEQSKSRYV